MSTKFLGNGTKIICKETFQILSFILHVGVYVAGYRTCVLVSHDWGGVLAYWFAAKHQDMIDKLIIMNAPHSGTMNSYVKKNKSQAKKSW